jgi:hypothetical protein
MIKVGKQLNLITEKGITPSRGRSLPPVVFSLKPGFPFELSALSLNPLVYSPFAFELLPY